MGVLTSIRMVRLHRSSVGFPFSFHCFRFFVGSPRVAVGWGRDMWHPSPRPPFVGRVRAKTPVFAGVFGSADDPHPFFIFFLVPLHVNMRK